MACVGYRSEYKEHNGSEALAAVIPGFGGKIEHSAELTENLLDNDYSVVTYEYDNNVLLDGDPQSLPQLISDIGDDFVNNPDHRNYSRRRIVGMSLGGLIGINIERAMNGQTEPGVYAAGGASLAWAVFRNPIFFPARLAFRKNGHTLPEVAEAWRPLYEGPGKPIAVALGDQDLISPYMRSLRQLEHWADGDPDKRIAIVKLKGRSHGETQTWFRQNISEMLYIADNINRH